MLKHPIATAAALILLAGAASAQGVDYYEFRQLEKRLEQSEVELQRLSNAVSGGDFLQRLEQVKGEIARVTGELEQLEFRMRQHEQQSKQKLEDLEYRIIELEGGDPSILFQQDAPVQPQQQGALGAPEQPSGGALGTLTTNSAGQTVAAAPARSIVAMVSRETAGRLMPWRVSMVIVMSGPLQRCVVCGDAQLGTNQFQ